MPLGIVLATAALLIVSALLFTHTYRRHMRGDDAPEKTIDVEILDKQSVAVTGTQPGEDDEEYWIYVQPLQGGPKREFMVGIHYFHALTPGDRGTLTYKGLSFVHFAQCRQ